MKISYLIKELERFRFANGNVQVEAVICKGKNIVISSELELNGFDLVDGEGKNIMEVLGE